MRIRHTAGTGMLRLFATTALLSVLLIAPGAAGAKVHAQPEAFAKSATVRAGIAAASHTRVLVRKFVRRNVGAYVRASSGVAIFVPPYVMSRSGYVTITPVGRGVYDIHIGPAWKGTVAVSLPVRGKGNAIIHDVGGGRVGGRVGG